MHQKVIIIGGGGHAKVVIDCIQACEDQVVGILDDNLDTSATVLGVPVLGKTTDYPRFLDYQFLIAIGNNHIRKIIANRMQGVKWHTAIHPRAVVSTYSKIGQGSVVLANAVVNAGTTIGEHCIVNTGSVVEHDNCVENFVHISPAAAIGGTVRIGECTHVGIGASVKNNLQIGSNCVVGAGAAVVKNISECGVYVGVPAYFRKKDSDPG